MYILEVIVAGVGAERSEHENWGDLMDAMDGLDYRFKSGEVSDFTVWKD